MLSLAYGDDQRADLTAHKPEVCYPAQGFQLHANKEDGLQTPFGTITACSNVRLPAWMVSLASAKLVPPLLSLPVGAT